MGDELETVGKVADATLEVAKTGAKAIDAASDTGRFFNAVFGDLVIDGVGLLHDRLKFYRAERWILLGEKTRERLAAKGITNYRPVPPKIALPLIESATIEDDDDLHSLWADLLTAAMNPVVGEIEPRFISAVKEMMPQDRLLMEYAWEHRAKIAHLYIGGSIEYEDTRNGELAGFDMGELGAAGADNASFERLTSIGIFKHELVEVEMCNPATVEEMIRTGGHPFSKTECIRYGDPRRFVLTDFGYRFCETVIAKIIVQ